MLWVELTHHSPKRLGDRPQIEGNQPGHLIIKNPTIRTTTPVHPSFCFFLALSLQLGFFIWVQDNPLDSMALLSLSFPSCLWLLPELYGEVPEGLGEWRAHPQRKPWQNFLNCLWGFFPS